MGLRRRCDTISGNIRWAIVVLLATAWPRVQHRTAEIRTAIEEVRPGELREVPI